MTIELDNWQPYTPTELHAVLAGGDFPYWLSGGYALEYFVGSAYRSHDDIDITIRRSDQNAIRAALPDYTFYAADPPGTLRLWGDDEWLPNPINDVWIKADPNGPFLFQLMLLDTEGERWVFKRDARLGGLLAEYGWQSDDGITVLKPEIQLLYKAKTIRPKDAVDFEKLLPLLSPAQKQWLREGLLIVHPDHAWLARLAL